MMARVVFSLLVVFSLQSLEVYGQDCPFGPPGNPVTYGVVVGPDTESVQWVENTSGHTFTFQVSNDGGCLDRYTISVGRFGSVTSASVSPTSVWVNPGEFTDVTVTYGVGAAPTGFIKVTAVGLTGATDNGTEQVTTKGPAGAPIVDISPYNSNDQDYARCAASCFAVVHAQSTVPYFSVDVPRSVALSYNGDRVNPKPFVHVNVNPDPGYGSTPTGYRLKLRINGAAVHFVNGEDTLRFAYSGTAPVRIGGQFDGSSYATGMYKLQIVVGATYASGAIWDTIETKLLVVNETTSPLARGWTVAGVQRAYTHGDSLLISEGDGSATYFARYGSSFISPPGDFSRVALATPSGWTRSYPDSTKVTFNSVGRMTQIADRFNNVTTIVYDGSNRVSQVKDPLNLATVLVYDANGLDKITDPMGRITQVTVDASKRLILFQDPDNVGTTFGYDASMRLSTITNRRGNTFTLGYDTQSGKAATTTTPSIQVVNADGSLSTTSLVTTFDAWQKRGVPYGSTSPAVSAPLRDTVYARMTDAGGHTTRITVNHWGTPAVVTNPLALSDSSYFDANGLGTRMVRSTGAIDSIIYNSSGLPTYVRTAGLNARFISYAGWAQVDSSWGLQLPSLKSFIGGNGRIDSTRTWGPGGAAVTRFTYEARGRVDKTVDPEGHQASRTWYTGTNSNRSKDSLPGGRVTTYSYDTYGRRISTTAPGLAVHRQAYDVLNRVTRDSMAGLPATVFAYDSLFLRSATDPKGQIYAFAYNALGWMTASTDPANHADSLKYDRDGLLRRSKNRRGQTIDYTYDVVHRAVTKSGTNTDAVTWTFSGDSRIASATSPWSVDSQFFSSTGFLDSTRSKLGGQTFSQRFGYTGWGTPDSITVAGGGISFLARKYVWDTQQGTLTTIRLNGGATTSRQSNRDGQVTATTFPANDQVSVAFTSVHAEAAISTPAVYGSSADRFIGLDPANRISRQIGGDGVTGRDFFYDTYGRLIADSAILYQGGGNPCAGDPPPLIGDNGETCAYSGTWIKTGGQAFSYDSVGNRRDQGGAYGQANRIRQFAGCTYVTDSLGDGSVLSRSCGAQTIRLYWSAESRLVAAKIVGADSLDFRYDAGGRLVRRDLNGTVQAYFLWQGGNLLAELNASATGKVAEYSYYPGLDNPHSLIVGNTAYFAHKDGNGSVIALTDDTAGLQRSYTYDAWGQLTAGLDNKPFGDIDRSRFKGALWMGVDLNLYYMRNRWYEPLTGRFLSEDQAGLSAGTNSYVYAEDDPVNSSDPLGLDENPCPPGMTLISATQDEMGDAVYTCQMGYGISGALAWGPDAFTRAFANGWLDGSSLMGVNGCVGFTSERCRSLLAVLDLLKQSRYYLCRAVVPALSSMLAAGKVRWNPKLPPGIYGATKITFPQGQPPVIEYMELGPLAFQPYELGNTFPHEGYHVLYPNDNAENHADAVGNTCGREVKI